MVSKRFNTKLLCLSVCILMLDIVYWIKVYSDIDIMLDSALSVRYRKFRYQAQSDIADHRYRTKCPPMAETMHECERTVIKMEIKNRKKEIIYEYQVKKY